MKILEFLFKMAMSVIHILLYAVIAAYLAEFFVTHPVVNPQFDGHPHWGTAALAAVAALVTCAVTFASEKDDAGEFMPSVFSRVAIIGVSWPFARLATFQDSAWEAAPFFVCAVALCVTGMIGIGGIVSRSRTAGLVLYATAALVYLFFGVYLWGQRSLAFERHDQQVDGVFEVRRWGGLHVDRVVTLTDVVGYQDKYQSDQFDSTSGEGITLMSRDGSELLISSARLQWLGLPQLVADQLTDFLESGRPSLRLVEKTPAAPFPLILLIACGIYYAGVTLDPQIRTATHPTDQRVTRYVGRVGLVLLMGCILSAIGYVWKFKAQQADAFRKLESVAEQVEVRDFVIREKTINSQAWFVRIGRREFRDADLEAIVPQLEEAPALWLDLSDTAVTDTGIAALTPLKVVQVLNLKGLSISAACQDALGKLWIQHLDLRGTEIRASDIQATKLRGVETLWITDPDFTNKDMPALFAIQNLEWLSVEASAFDPKELLLWREELEGIEVEIVPLHGETDQFEDVE